jgi:hypothetical protein
MLTPRHARLIAALVALLSLTAMRAEPIDFAAVDPADHAFDDWYLDTIDGRPAGYWRNWMAIEDGQIVSGYEEVGVEAHGGESLHTRTRVVWTETLDFKIVSIVVENLAGSDAVKQTFRFNDDGVELTSTQNGRSIKQQLPPIQDDYLTAAQQNIAVALHLKRGDKQFAYDTLDPLVGMKPYKTRYRRSADKSEPVELVDGSKTNATPWTVTYDILPGFEMKMHIDQDARAVGLAYDLGGMTLVSRLADETVTQVKLDPPEMSQLSVVVPDRPIDNPLKQRKIVYELTYEAGDSAITPIQTTRQRVEKLGKNKVRVTVDLDAKPDKEGDAKQDKPVDAHLAASIMIDHEDQAVRKLAERAANTLIKDATPEALALACKRLVTRHLSEATLAVGDATASEAARTRRGDCTECAVLLAAMLRAHGIPSRCVTGLVYSEDAFVGTANAFVYHMWTQAWIEDEHGVGRWIDLDAAMWRYSACHIALGVSSMGDNDRADLIKLIPMMQGLKISVKQTSEE